MQSFYKRFIRDFVRYKDHIQCAGDELVRAVRADSLRTYPGQGGVYYALHVRRGDFQFKVLWFKTFERLFGVLHCHYKYNFECLILVL